MYFQLKFQFCIICSCEQYIQ